MSNLRTYLLVVALACFLSQAKIFAQRTSTPATGNEVHERLSLPLRVRSDSPLWERYLSAGQQFKKQGDMPRAKAYFVEALNQLERNPKFGRVSAISALQQNLLKLYPQFGEGEQPDEGPKQIKLLEEEIPILQRLDRLGKLFPGRGLEPMSLTLDYQIKSAQKDLEKNKAAVKQKSERSSN